MLESRGLVWHVRQWDVSKPDSLPVPAKRHVQIPITSRTWLSTDLKGSVHANQVSIASNQRIEGTAIEYVFSGTVQNGAMQGTVTMGEYGDAKRRAVRHTYPA